MDFWELLNPYIFCYWVEFDIVKHLVKSIDIYYHIITLIYCWRLFSFVDIYFSMFLKNSR